MATVVLALLYTDFLLLGGWCAAWSDGLLLLSRSELACLGLLLKKYLVHVFRD